MAWNTIIIMRPSMWQRLPTMTCKSLYNNTYLSYSKTFGKDHVFSSMTGVHIQSNTYQLDWGIAKNAHENDQYRELQDGQANLREIGGQNRDWNWISMYENL